MIGVGVFAAVGPAAEVAGSGPLVGLAIAAAVAYCNATSSAALAAIYPASGGTYVYGRERLGLFWGYLAGWGFVVGKTASCAAMALTVGLTPRRNGSARSPSPPSSGSPPSTTSASTRPPRSPGFSSPSSSPHSRSSSPAQPWAGPRAIPRALGITLIVYAAVALSSLAAVGPIALSQFEAPLATAVRAGNLDVLVPAVRIGGTVAARGVLLSLIAGVSRTAFAMAADRELPGWLDAIHPTHKVPHRAEHAAGALIALLVALTDLRGAIGFSSFCVLGYYAIANASAWTLPPQRRRRPRALAAAGAVGCVILALTLPIATVVTGAGVLAIGALIWAVRHRRRRFPAPPNSVGRRYCGGARRNALIETIRRQARERREV